MRWDVDVVEEWRFQSTARRRLWAARALGAAIAGAAAIWLASQFGG